MGEDEIFALQADLKDIDALGEERSGGIQRGDVAQFARAESAWILIAPMMAIERGHNILNMDRVAAFGAALFLVRPFPVPDNPELLVQMLNYWTIEKLAIATFLVLLNLTWSDNLLLESMVIILLHEQEGIIIGYLT